MRTNCRQYAADVQHLVKRDKETFRGVRFYASINHSHGDSRGQIMIFKRLSTICAIAILGGSLLGCNSIDARQGLNPEIDEIAVENSSNRINNIMAALARDTYPGGGPVNYYMVAQAGFNFIDDQCSAYFDHLFFLDRGRSQLKSGLAATGATTAAILGATHASAVSLSVVAAAFGLASSATDIVAGTYLYALPPAATKDLVNSLQTKYRGEAQGIANQINSPIAAYHQIQGYLDLCLPPTIEAQVTKLVTQAKPKATRFGTTISVRAN